MNFLGMGPMELLLIAILAMIVFGPGRLPEIMGQIGRVVREFRRTTTELSEEFNRTLQAEMGETKQIVDELRQELAQTKAAVHEAASLTYTPPAPPPLVSEPTVVAPEPVVEAGPSLDAPTTNGTATPGVTDTRQPWSWESSPGEPGPVAAPQAALDETAVNGTATPPPEAVSPARPARRARAKKAASPTASETSLPQASTNGAAKPPGDEDLLPPY